MRASRWVSCGAVVEVVALLVVATGGGGPAGRALRAGLVLTGLAVPLLARVGRHRAAAAVALVLGGVGLAVGAGVAPRHLAAGASLHGIAAGVLAVAALVTAVAATAVLVAGGRRRRRLLAVPIAVLVVLLTVPTAVAVAAADPPSTPLGEVEPSDVGVAAEVVSFPAADGTRLEGWWSPGRNGAAVVLLHGSGTNRATLLDPMAVLVDAGYGVLAFDARGHGGSDGHGMDLGWRGPDDLRGAIRFVTSQPGVQTGRVAALGLSMGGEVALSTLSDPGLAAVVAEGATRRSAADDGWLPTHPGGVVQRAMDRWQDAVAAVLTGASAPRSLRDEVADGSVPVLLVTAGTEPDERAAARWIASAAPACVEVWTVDGAAHTGGLAADPAGWAVTVVGFLDRSVGPGAPARSGADGGG